MTSAIRELETKIDAEKIQDPGRNNYEIIEMLESEKMIAVLDRQKLRKTFGFTQEVPARVG